MVTLTKKPTAPLLSPIKTTLVAGALLAGAVGCDDDEVIERDPEGGSADMYTPAPDGSIFVGTAPVDYEFVGVGGTSDWRDEPPVGIAPLEDQFVGDANIDVGIAPFEDQFVNEAGTQAGTQAGTTGGQG